MLFERTFYLEKIEAAFQKVSIVVLIGARQVGKTSIMAAYKPDLKKIVINGQDPEIIEVFEKFSVLEKFLSSKLDSELNGMLVIDEFQYIPSVSVFLKLLGDKYPKLKMLCSGSSSLDILQKVEESLAGRVRVIEVYSLAFSEYLQFQSEELYQQFLKTDCDTPVLALDKQTLLYLNEYLVFGGFPRVALASGITQKVELLDDIYQTYLLHDVRSYIKNEDSTGFNKLLRLLSSQIGNLININEVSQTCGLTYRKCEDYLYLLEQMFIIKLVEPSFSNKRKVITKLRKLYFTEIGLRNIIHKNFNEITFRPDNGALFENYVFLNLHRHAGKTSSIQYYRTLDGSEVDFIVETPWKTYSVEVKYKNFKKPVVPKNLLTYNEVHEISNSLLINQNLNTEVQNVRFLPGILIENFNFFPK